jgi:hypothetical protein
VVVQLVEEHLIDKAFPGHVTRNSRRHLGVMAFCCLMEQAGILFLDITATGNAEYLVEVLLRVKAPAFHHLIELFPAEREAEGERVKLRLLPLA